MMMMMILHLSYTFRDFDVGRSTQTGILPWSLRRERERVYCIHTSSHTTEWQTPLEKHTKSISKHVHAEILLDEILLDDIRV